MDDNSSDGLSRRGLITGGAALLGMASTVAASAARAQSGPITDPALQPDPAALARIIAEFLNGSEPIGEGLALELPPIGDNPAQVPLRAHVTLTLTDGLHCPEMIILAERNPHPLACRLRFSPGMGLADVSTRVRLTQSQHVSAYARLSDGRVLMARQDIIVTAGGCGI